MRIFTRIFLSFWVTFIALILMGFVFVFVFSSRPNQPWKMTRVPIRICALAALTEYERGGREALSRYLGASTPCDPGVMNRRDYQYDYFEPQAPLPTDIPPQYITPATIKSLPFGGLIAYPATFDSQLPSTFVYIRPHRILFVKSALPPRTLLFTVVFRLGLLALVSATCCYLLTLYLVKPIMRLGKMAEGLGSGDLGVRIEASLSERPDELGELSRRFNQMASEIDSLVTRQRRFLAHASHELGSPLTRVNIALGLAKKKSDNIAVPELDRIGREADRLNVLVQELLLLARLESGNEHDRQTTSFRIGTVTEEAYADASFEAGQMNKTVVIRSSEDFTVSGYPDILRRALDNILRNALRFAREHGTVYLDLRRDSSANAGFITIEDDGPGISSDQLDMIFEPFVRLSEGARSGDGGSGLGLAIAREAVRANGGTIAAQNGITGGLVVSIVLPIAQGVQTD
jgi:two-component system sensor histidine kinase CpxA